MAKRPVFEFPLIILLLLLSPSGPPPLRVTLGLDDTPYVNLVNSGFYTFYFYSRISAVNINTNGKF